MIVTESLTKRYGGKTALDALDLVVEPGEILGFLGPNGAGKSTTVKILTGLLQADGGRARVAGFDVATESMEVKKRVGYVPETPAVYPSLTADEYLELVGCLHHLEDRASAVRRQELLDLFGLAEVRPAAEGVLEGDAAEGGRMAISSPDDHAILGFRPVTSRTYLLACVASLSARTVAIALLVAIASLIALLVKHGIAPAAAGLLSVTLTALATTLVVVALYAWLLRVLGPRTLGRVISYAQLVVNLVVWLGFIVVTQGLQQQVLAGLRLDDPALLLGYPGCWFASWVALAAGAADPPHLIGAALSIGAVGLLG